MIIISNYTRQYRTAVILSVCVLLSSCIGSRTFPETNYYLLAIPDHAQAAPADPLIEVQSVRLPPYLDRLGIVLVNEGRQIQVANYHFWAEPLDDAVARILQDELARSWRGETGILDVDIHFFHGDLPGLVTLDTSWAIQMNCDELVSSRFRHTLGQPSSGYFALVETHADLVMQLASAIVNSLESQGVCTSQLIGSPSP